MVEVDIPHYRVFLVKTSDRKEIHKQIFQIIYYGNGGFNHSDVYNMPSYLRMFYLNELSETKKQENKQIEDMNKKTNTPSKSVYNPRFKR